MPYKSYTTLIFSANLFLLTLFSFLFYKFGGYWYMGIIPFAVLTIGLLVFKTPIDRYFLSKKEMGIDETIYGMIATEYPEILKYSPEETKIFKERMFYFLFDRECYLVTEETEDLDLYHSVLMSVPGVIMNMGEQVDEARDIERFVAYKHPFPSPKMQFIHTAEYDGEDGVMIVSIEQMMLSLRLPAEYYHIVYHIWAERYIYTKKGFPSLPEDFVQKLPLIFGFDKKSIDKLLGYDVKNINAIALCAYFTRNKKMETIFPDFYYSINEYL